MKIHTGATREHDSLRTSVVGDGGGGDFAPAAFSVFKRLLHRLHGNTQIASIPAPDSLMRS